MTISTAAVMMALCSTLSLACTKHVDGCVSNIDCTDPAYPFCDVDGAYAPSGGDKNVCTIIPPDCPVDVCGCAPGAATCGSDTLTTCNADGKSTSMASCSLGCSADGLGCNTFTPSNGLGPTFIVSASLPDVTIPSGSTLNTDTGEVTTPDGTQLNVTSSLVSQSVGMIRAFGARTFTIGNLVVTGSNPLALVAAEDIALNGILSVSANGITPGPGAQPVGTPCDGVSVFVQECHVGTQPSVPCTTGGGGGGNATVGGVGGTYSLISAGGTGAGGLVQMGFSPLVGGCSGGSVTFTEASTEALPGGGGGAVQLVSGGTLELVGIVHVGGGGGSVAPGGAGGGAGGTVIIETPGLSISATGGIATNGGGAGGCGVPGSNATPDGNAAPGGNDGSSICSGTDYSLAGGVGGTITLPPGSGGFDTRTVLTSTDHDFGGGGGSVGRARIATRDGTYASMPSSLMSAVVTTDTLVTQ